MNKRSPFYLRGLAWLAGGLIFWIFISLHAVMLLDSEAGLSPFGKWDAFFALVFGGLVFLLIRALIRKTRGVYRAGAVFRVFLTLSSLLGALTPVSMILGFIRIGLKSESPSMGGLFFMFISFWGLVGAMFCFGCRFLFKPSFPQTESGAERSRKNDFEMEIRDASASGIRSGPVPQDTVSRSSSKTALYALLQTSMDQKLPLGALEAASRAVPEICTVDCARMSREAFGIVISDLSTDVSRAFQRALRDQGIETLRVSQRNLFKLPSGRLTRNLRFEGGKMIETDMFGREWVISTGDCAFLAAGCIHDRIRDQESHKLKRRQVRNFDRSTPEIEAMVSVIKKDVWVPATFFRIELILLREPHRLIWQCDPTRPSILNGRAVRAEENADAIKTFLAQLSEWLPEGQMNRGVRDSLNPEGFSYPSLSAFEEEIIWSLTRRISSDG